MFIKELKEKEDLSDEEYKNRVKAYMNIYTARLKMRVSNVKTMISVMKKLLLVFLKKGITNKSDRDHYSEHKSDDYHDHKFEAFDTEKFWESIKDKNYLRLKVNFVSSMLQDPTFDRGDINRIIKIFDKEVPEIWEMKKN